MPTCGFLTIRRHRDNLDFVTADIPVPNSPKQRQQIQLDPTEEGMKIASKIYERHETLAHLFMSLGVNEETAYEDACRIEHDLSDETFQALKNHYINHMSQA